jgi:hypothetical protein
MSSLNVSNIKTTIISAFPRLAGGLLIALGVAHLLIPSVLLSTAKRGYDLVLDVQFRPRDGAETRVQSVGVVMLATGMHLLYHGSPIPGRFRSA